MKIGSGATGAAFYAKSDNELIYNLYSAKWDSAKWDLAKWDSAKWESAKWDSTKWEGTLPNSVAIFPPFRGILTLPNPQQAHIQDFDASSEPCYLRYRLTNKTPAC